MEILTGEFGEKLWVHVEHNHTDVQFMIGVIGSTSEVREMERHIDHMCQCHQVGIHRFSVHNTDGNTLHTIMEVTRVNDNIDNKWMSFS